MVGQKRKSTSDSVSQKKRQAISFKLKLCCYVCVTHTMYCIVQYEQSYITGTYSNNLRSFSRYVRPFGT